MRLLLAGDSPVYSGIVMHLLRANHYETDAVCTGSEALGYLLSGLYDAAIVDIDLPGIGGVQVIRRAREAGIAVPILVLTTHVGVEALVQALDAGANDYLLHPFHEKELLARIRVLTRCCAARSSPVPESSEMQLGDLVLDRTSFSIRSCAGSVRLTGKEYQILEMLMANPDMRISAEHMLARIWGREDGADIHVLWVHLCYLRRKLRRTGCSVEIRTIRNGGYYLAQVSSSGEP